MNDTITESGTSTKSVDKVVQCFTSAQTARAANDTRWDRWYKIYRTYRDKKKYEFRANLVQPHAFQVVETELPRIISTIFAASPFIEIKPREESDVINADMVEELLEYQLMDRVKIVPKMVTLIKECLIYGTSVAKVYWKKEMRNQKRKVTKMVPQIDPMMQLPGQPQPTQVVENVPTPFYDDPEVEVVDLYDIYIDPAATSIENAKWIIHRSIVDFDYLKDLEIKEDGTGTYKNLAEVEADCKSVDSPRAKRMQNIGLDNIYGTKDDKTKRVEILEYWEDDKVITIANRNTEIRNEENPYWHMSKPFIEIVDHPVMHEFYGIGEIEPVESLIRESQDLRNQRMDNVNLILNRMSIIKRGSGVDTKKLISQPGGSIMVNDMNGFKWDSPPDVTQSSYVEVQEISKNIQDALGVSSYIAGQTDSSQTKTSSGINMMQQAASARFNLKIRIIESMFIEKLANMVIALDQQFMTKPRMVRILGAKGAEFKAVSSDQITGNYDYIPIGSSMMANKEIRLQQMIGMKKVLADDPTINHKAYNERMLKYTGEPAVDELINKEPPQPPPPPPSTKLNMSLALSPMDLLDPQIQALIKDAGIQMPSSLLIGAVNKNVPVPKPVGVTGPVVPNATQYAGV